MTRTRTILVIALILAFVLLAALLVPKLALAKGGNLMPRAAVAADLGSAFTYQGYLDDNGSPADGSYNFRFYLWDDSAKNTLLATFPSDDNLLVMVDEGLFTVELDFGDQAFNGQERWLEIEVDGVPLTPLQPLTPSPYALSLRPGALISGSSSGGILRLSNTTGDGLRINQLGDDGIDITSAGDDGVDVDSAIKDGFKVDSAGDDGLDVVAASVDGVRVRSAGNAGVDVTSAGGNGLFVDSAGHDGLHVISAGHNGVRIMSAGDDGLFICTTGNKENCDAEDEFHHGVEIGSTEHSGINIDDAGFDGLHITNAGEDGVQVSTAGANGLQVLSAGSAGVSVNNAGTSGFFVLSTGGDGVVVDQAGDDAFYTFSAGGDYFQAGGDTNPKFKVLNTGEVRSDVGFNTPAADFAEMMALEGDPANYGPGDALVISSTQVRAVALSAGPYAKAVIGVYSTAPAFVGGQPVADTDMSGMAPVGVLGIVPTKVSAENGAIEPGDLLVTSSTPGHAMRSDDPPPGTVLGKALEPLESGAGVILVLVTLQ